MATASEDPPSAAAAPEEAPAEEDEAGGDLEEVEPRRGPSIEPPLSGGQPEEKPDSRQGSQRGSIVGDAALSENLFAEELRGTEEEPPIVTEVVDPYEHSEEDSLSQFTDDWSKVSSEEEKDDSEPASSSRIFPGRRCAPGHLDYPQRLHTQDLAKRQLAMEMALVEHAQRLKRREYQRPASQVKDAAKTEAHLADTCDRLFAEAHKRNTKRVQTLESRKNKEIAAHKERQAQKAREPKFRHYDPGWKGLYIDGLRKMMRRHCDLPPDARKAPLPGPLFTQATPSRSPSRALSPAQGADCSTRLYEDAFSRVEAQESRLLAHLRHEETTLQDLSIHRSVSPSRKPGEQPAWERLYEAKPRSRSLQSSREASPQTTSITLQSHRNHSRSTTSWRGGVSDVSIFDVLYSDASRLEERRANEELLRREEERSMQRCPAPTSKAKMDQIVSRIARDKKEGGLKTAFARLARRELDEVSSNASTICPTSFISVMTTSSGWSPSRSRDRAPLFMSRDFVPQLRGGGRQRRGRSCESPSNSVEEDASSEHSLKLHRQNSLLSTSLLQYDDDSLPQESKFIPCHEVTTLARREVLMPTRPDRSSSPPSDPNVPAAQPMLVSHIEESKASCDESTSTDQIQVLSPRHSRPMAPADVREAREDALALRRHPEPAQALAPAAVGKPSKSSSKGPRRSTSKGGEKKVISTVEKRDVPKDGPEKKRNRKSKLKCKSTSETQVRTPPAKGRTSK